MPNFQTSLYNISSTSSSSNLVAISIVPSARCRTRNRLHNFSAITTDDPAAIAAVVSEGPSGSLYS